jgi:hypothetical protein
VSVREGGREPAESVRPWEATADDMSPLPGVREIPAVRPGPHRSVALLAIALAVVEILSLLGGGLALGPHPTGSLGTVVGAPDRSASSVPAAQVADAEASLAGGQAPGAVSPTACDPAGLPGFSGACASRATGSGTAATGVTNPDWSMLVSPQPPGRDGAAIVYDARDNYVLMFGGYSSGTFLGDTWKYSGGTWTLLHPATSPGPRANAAIAFDGADHYVVLYGGWTGNLSKTHVLSDTWTYAGGIWTALAPAKNPGPLVAASMSYDASSGKTILFGGGNATFAVTNKTWEFHAGTWSRLFPKLEPPARDWASMAYDAADATIVLFGGWLENRSQPALGDTWTYSGTKWTRLTPSPAPTARFAAGMAYSPIDGAIVLFGGIPFPATLAATSDTWSYSGGNWTKVGPLGHPSNRDDPSMADGTNTTGVVLFGGVNNSFVELNDTWTYHDLGWFHVLPRTPEARFGASLAYDGTDGYVVLFGGETSSGGYLGDTWKFSNGLWTPLHPSTAPSPRVGAAMAYDPSDGYLVLFGGVATGGTLSDTWTFVGGSWSELHQSGGPTGRYAPSMVYDYADGYVLLFGGWNSTKGFLGDTWSFSGGAWTPQPVGSTHPAARNLAAMAYDSADGYVVLFSGQTTNTSVFADTWSYVGGVWTNRTAGLSRHPPALFAASMSDDSYDGYLVLYGGSTGTGPVNSTWSFANGNWTALAPATNPGARDFQSVAYDPAESSVVEFGGAPTNAETWLY